MKKSLVVVGTLLVLGASAASAQGQINLAWDDCGTNGTVDKVFACDSNAGAPFSMVASFIPPAALPEYLGMSAQIDMKFDLPQVPLWWQHGTGLCRGTTGLATNFDFTSGPFNCIDFYVGAAAGGFAYDVGYGTPNRARFRVTCAVPFDNKGPITTADHYYAFKGNVLRAKTTGAGNCIECNIPGCIVLNEIQLFQPPEQANDPIITTPGTGNHVTWQGGANTNCPQSTPTKSATWGQVKSLYRN